VKSPLATAIGHSVSFAPYIYSQLPFVFLFVKVLSIVVVDFWCMLLLISEDRSEVLTAIGAGVRAILFLSHERYYCCLWVQVSRLFKLVDCLIIYFLFFFRKINLHQRWKWKSWHVLRCLLFLKADWEAGSNCQLALYGEEFCCYVVEENVVVVGVVLLL